MMPWIRRSIAACLVIALAAIAPAGAASDASDSAESLLHRSSQEAGAVRSYWTPQRMRQAEGLDLLQVGGGQPRTISAGGSGAPALRPPSPPTEARRSSESPTAFRGGGPIPYTRSEIADPSAFPYRTNGRLFGVDGNGEQFACSATAVSAQSRSVVFTAGHCVYLVEAGGWSQLLSFVPGYEDGTAPYGEWPIVEVWSPAGWIGQQSAGYDVAALVTAPSSEGMRLEDLVGGRGIAWNISRHMQFDAFGYPAVPPFTGEQLLVCESEYGLEEPFFIEKPRPTGIGCDMTEGSSGGGWIIRDVYLNGVNSYGIDGLPEVMFGPYFGDAVAGIYGSASISTTPGPLPAETPPEPLVGQIHRMALSLRLAGRLVARGKLTAPDGYAACTRGAPVAIFRRSRGGFVLVKMTSTDQKGTYGVKVRDVAGRYLAFSPEGSVDDLNVCSEVKSRPSRRR